jgi:AraC family transcriptional regulator, ethanolamine operon transcriptional activator
LQAESLASAALRADDGAAMSEFQYSRVLTSDAEQHGSSLSTWEQRYEQLSTGRFEGCLEDLRMGPVQLFLEYANRSVLQGGRARPGSIAIAFPRLPAGDEPGWCSGHPLREDQALVVSSDTEFDLVAGAGTTLLAVCVDQAELVQRAWQLHRQELRLDVDRPALLDRTCYDHEGTRALVEHAMALARQQPGVLAQPAARQALTESITDALLGCFVPGRPQAEVRPGAAARRRIVSDAWDYMRTHVDEPITVPQLCLATGASRRALQYAFEDVLRLSPVTYLRVMRLNRVRSEIRSRSQDTVGDIAARWGFWHLSRFAAEYRELFGELPSATRQRGVAGV